MEPFLNFPFAPWCDRDLFSKCLMIRWIVHDDDSGVLQGWATVFPWTILQMKHHSFHCNSLQAHSSWKIYTKKSHSHSRIKQDTPCVTQYQAFTFVHRHLQTTFFIITFPEGFSWRVLLTHILSRFKIDSLLLATFLFQLVHFLEEGDSCYSNVISFNKKFSPIHCCTVFKTNNSLLFGELMNNFTHNSFFFH